MNSVATRILALLLLGTASLGVLRPAYGATTGGCHHSCSAVWLAQRRADINAWVECKTQCTGLSGRAKSACSALCFKQKNAALAQDNAQLRQCFHKCLNP
jgi:hypothetical protein